MICQSARQAGVEAEGGVKEGKRVNKEGRTGCALLCMGVGGRRGWGMCVSGRGKKRNRPQPRLRCLRTEIEVNANRTHLDRGSDTPLFPYLYQKGRDYPFTSP